MAVPDQHHPARGRVGPSGSSRAMAAARTSRRRSVDSTMGLPESYWENQNWNWLRISVRHSAHSWCFFRLMIHFDPREIWQRVEWADGEVPPPMPPEVPATEPTR